jgi:hypothetical protein
MESTISYSDPHTSAGIQTANYDMENKSTPHRQISCNTRTRKNPDVAIQSRWPAQLKKQSDELRPTQVSVKNLKGVAPGALRRGNERNRHQALQLNQPAWPLGISRASALAGIYESPGNLGNPATVLRPGTKKPL